MPTFFRDTDLFKPKAKNFMFGLGSNSIIHKVVDESEEYNNSSNSKPNVSPAKTDSTDKSSDNVVAIDSTTSVTSSMKADEEETDEDISANDTSDDLQITDIRSITTEDSISMNSKTEGLNNTPDSSITSIGSVDHLLKAIGELTQSKKVLESDLNKTNDKLKSNTSEITRKNEIIESFKVRIAKLNENFCAIEEAIASTKKKANHFEQDLRSVKIDTKFVQNDLKNSKTLISSLTVKNEQFKSALNLLRVDNDILQNDIKAKGFKIDDISGRLSEEKIRNSQLEKELNLVRNKYESSLGTQINGNKDAISDLSRIIIEKFENLNEISVSADQKLDGKLDGIKANNNKLRTEIEKSVLLGNEKLIQSYNNCIDTINNKFKTIMKENFGQTETQISKLGELFEDFRRNNIQKDEVIQNHLNSKFEKIINEISNQFNEIRISKDLNLKEISSDYRKLMNDFKAENSKLIILQHENETLKLANISNAKKVEVLEDKLNSISSQLGKKTIENTKLSNQLHLKESTIQDLKTEISRSNAKLVTNESKLKELKKSNKVCSKRKLIGGSSSGSSTAALSINSTTIADPKAMCKNSKVHNDINMVPNSRKVKRKFPTNKTSMELSDFELPDSSLEDVQSTMGFSSRKRAKK